MTYDKLSDDVVKSLKARHERIAQLERDIDLAERTIPDQHGYTKGQDFGSNQPVLLRSPSGGVSEILDLDEVDELISAGWSYL